MKSCFDVLREIGPRRRWSWSLQKNSRMRQLKRIGCLRRLISDGEAGAARGKDEARQDSSRLRITLLSRFLLLCCIIIKEKMLMTFWMDSVRKARKRRKKMIFLADWLGGVGRWDGRMKIWTSWMS